MGEVWGKGSVYLAPISEGDEEDARSIPDNLPDLIDSAGERGRPSPIGLVQKGIAPPRILLYQDSVRPNRFWLCL